MSRPRYIHAIEGTTETDSQVDVDVSERTCSRQEKLKRPRIQRQNAFETTTGCELPFLSPHAHNLKSQQHQVEALFGQTAAVKPSRNLAFNLDSTASRQIPVLSDEALHSIVYSDDEHVTQKSCKTVCILVYF